MAVQGGQISNIPFPTRSNWSVDGKLSPEAIAVFEELNKSLAESVQNGQLTANGVLYGDTSGNVQGVLLNDHEILTANGSGVPISLTFGQNEFLGTLASGGLINMSRLQVTDQLDLTGMVGKTQGGSVTDAVASTVDVTGADVVDSTVSVTSPDATDLPTVLTLSNELKSDVNQLVSDVNSKNALINEIKSDVNTLVTDVNNTITQINLLLASLRGGDLIDT